MKIIIVKTMNQSPEEEVNRRLEELGEGWKIISATTAMALFGERQSEEFEMLAHHLYYVTTVVVERG